MEYNGLLDKDNFQSLGDIALRIVDRFSGADTVRGTDIRAAGQESPSSLSGSSEVQENLKIKFNLEKWAAPKPADSSAAPAHAGKGGSSRRVNKRRMSDSA